MSDQHKIELFYDGGCPLCRREINMLRRMDRQNLILFSNIADSQFDFKSRGKTFDQLMSQVHAQLSDGTWITGVEVFRRLYTAVGYGWLVLPTRLPGVSRIFDILYSVFAKNRLKLGRRCNKKNSCYAVTHEINEVNLSK